MKSVTVTSNNLLIKKKSMDTSSEVISCRKYTSAENQIHTEQRRQNATSVLHQSNFLL